jgi:hypothetical protein
VALIVGTYFHAIHGAISGNADPLAQDRLCQAKARRFLAMLRGVPDRRRQMSTDRTERLRQAGLVVFPNPDEE